MGSRTLGSLGAGFAYAAEHAREGWTAFPLMPGTKVPVPGSRGHNAATSNLRDLASIWEGALISTGLPDLGVGFRCSGPAGFCVDLDVKNGKDGIATFREIAWNNDMTWDSTWARMQWPAGWLRYRTRSGGMHIIFASPIDGRPVHTGADVLGPGVDLRGIRGYRATYDPAAPEAYTLLSKRYVNHLPPAPAWLLADERLYGPASVPEEAVALTDGALCPAVLFALDHARWDFSDHHSCATRILHLVRLGEEGHTGVLDALASVFPMYVNARNAKSELDGQERDPESDFERMVSGALGKGTGATSDTDPCTRAAERLARFRL